MSAELRTTALSGWHLAAGAKMGDFAGWSMPLEYPSGTVTEHRAVRSGCGVFDVSHMGNVFVVGEAAVAGANQILTNDLGRLTPGDLQYTMLCNEAGGVIDDMMVTRLAADRLMIVPNAANTAAVIDVLQSELGEAVVDHSEATAIIAVQGPASPQVLDQLGLPWEHDYMTMHPARFDAGDHEVNVMVSRSGYTGERGYELMLPASGAAALWEFLVEQPRVTPAGLGARDTLRTEMGYALHGHEISPGITPVEASLGWAVAWDKPAFHGRAALVAQRGAEGGRRLRGLRVSDRGVPRAEMPVLVGDLEVGRTTSGTFSPTLRAGIALALVDREVALGDRVDIEVRGRRLAAEVVKPPFVAASPK